MTNALKKITCAGVTALAVLSMAGCAHGPSRSQLGTGAGAVVGGVAGNALFGSTLGTVGGAAAGALVGNELSKGGRGGRRR
ncbi:glycine zipper 2TM domain-containing protein [Comamonas endophytica]|uniref:Glycine zipper 2TM domain-containing protein n=1 Tax=Comamonas endophytica TaxID=2949090 RepID=A0ABY6GBE0_9BURK|nr:MULTISPECIES: glycine zipper 2TM domain-containing protein [unclassified Acidovorax]MCD2513618.1 glycine zipper 2TM domain-containing protein [Acidovorax sp. D4N7]UYG52374.1 glycine zipper 2TM domain-containing protein [Acidovorax sp. 5MLIR]